MQSMPRVLLRTDIKEEEMNCVIESMPRPTWESLVRPGTIGVRARVLLNRNRIVLANLRFEPGGTIDAHSAPIEIDVICLEGRGFVSIDGKSSPFSAGDRVVWPAGVPHRLWTEADAMETLMVERH